MARIVNGRRPIRNWASAGYTYLGQLVIHDLTYSKTVRPDFAKSASLLANLRSPKLDLDNLYGKWPRN